MFISAKSNPEAAGSEIVCVGERGWGTPVVNLLKVSWSWATPLSSCLL
jgi:hypothetical protein